MKDRRRRESAAFGLVITKYVMEFNATELRTVLSLLRRGKRRQRATFSTLARYVALEKRICDVLGKPRYS